MRRLVVSLSARLRGSGWRHDLKLRTHAEYENLLRPKTRGSTPWPYNMWSRWQRDLALETAYPARVGVDGD